MRAYLVRRFLLMLLLLVLGSMVSFLVITLPPFDYVSDYVARLQASGADVSPEQILALRRYYGVDDPKYLQYLKWMFRLLQGDPGRSFGWNRPIGELIMERLPMTLVVGFGALIVTYAIAIPIGIYSAVKQYSVGDYAVSFVGFIGLSVPNFLLALIVMIAAHNFFGLSIGGLFSPQYDNAPWSTAKLLDLLAHLPIPLLVIGLASTASVIRTMRAMLLDELRKPYVQTARAKGVKEWELILRYPVRVALLPIVASLAFALPTIFSGTVIVGIVLNLPTMGPLLYNALVSVDLFLAATTLLITIAMTVVGTFLSDLLLAVLDPRISYA
jgi:peptide/nickel transport system permease protein